MRHFLPLSLTLLGVAGCVVPPTTTTYVTPATTTTYTTPATSTTVVNAPPGYQQGYVAPATYLAPPTTTTVIRTP